MEGTPIPRHFLDSSVARPMLFGTQTYKQYFASQFGDNPRYISAYVQMELRRSYLRNMVDFYFTLRLPTLHTISDAFSFWSNHFRTSGLKAALQLAGDLFALHRLDFTRPRDKAKALHVLGGYIRRVELKMRRTFTDIGKDSTRCTRAAVPFKVELTNMAAGFKQFVEAFDDVETCRARCRIDHFLLNRYRPEVEAYIAQSSQLPKNTDTRGFIAVAENLREIREEGATACSCKRCERIGDAVIALDAPRNMRLEHTDQSFNHLCPPIDQSHHQHPSETQIVRPKLPDREQHEFDI
jgi:hypothetical protein